MKARASTLRRAAAGLRARRDAILEEWIRALVASGSAREEVPGSDAWRSSTS